MQRNITDAEYNVINKILTRSHIDDILYLTMDNNHDCFLDLEEDTNISLEDGLQIMREGYTNDNNVYGLSDKETQTFTSLLIDANILQQGETL